MNDNQMTAQEARQWMICQWDADQLGTDLDWERLEGVYHSIFGCMPSEDGDAFGDLKNLIEPTLTAAESAEIELSR